MALPRPVAPAHAGSFHGVDVRSHPFVVVFAGFTHPNGHLVGLPELHQIHHAVDDIRVAIGDGIVLRINPVTVGVVHQPPVGGEVLGQHVVVDVAVSVPMHPDQVLVAFVAHHGDEPLGEIANGRSAPGHTVGLVDEFIHRDARLIAVAVGNGVPNLNQDILKDGVLPQIVGVETISDAERDALATGGGMHVQADPQAELRAPLDQVVDVFETIKVGGGGDASFGHPPCQRVFVRIMG